MTQNIKSFDDIAESFAETRQTPWPEFNIVREHIKEGGHVLDVGCANGRLYKFLEEKLPNISYHGIDISEKLISIARAEYGDEIFEHADMSEYKKQNAYDNIILIAAFHHLQTHEERKRTIENWHKSLKDGGVVIITVWNIFQKKYRKYVWSSFWRACIGLGKFRDVSIPWKREKPAIDRYYHAFTKKELRKLLTDSNFVVEACEYTDMNGYTNSILSARNILLIAKKRS